MKKAKNDKRQIARDGVNQNPRRSEKPVRVAARLEGAVKNRGIKKKQKPKKKRINGP